MTTEQRLLLHLARLHGVQPDYRGADGLLHRSPPEAILATLKALGADVRRGTTGLREAILIRRREAWREHVAPVTVLWDGTSGAGLGTISIRLPARSLPQRLSCSLRLEEGSEVRWEADPADLTTLRAREVDGVRYLAKGLAFPGAMPTGYHRLSIEGLGSTAVSHVITAPRSAGPVEQGTAREWGVFLPLYALRREGDWGTGDFTGLTHLGAWGESLGARVLATLPLLASFLDEPLEWSPYAPVSRLAWNELYIDVERLAGVTQGPPPLSGGMVDYQRTMAAKRAILEPLSARLSEDDPDYQDFLRGHPHIPDYAAFRAATEKQGATWPNWPSRMREGSLQEGDYDPSVARYHRYVQWVAHRRLEGVVKDLRPMRLYLDLPLGVHSDGFDVWRFREAFAQGVSGGAPPDSLFTGGQDWGFPPLHPQRTRRDGHAYFIACLRHHLQVSGMLRIDHVMGLHRLFWVPYGMSARDGVYVRYPAEELYAVLCLEAGRHRATIVGENLGTVPSYVNTAMDRHGLSKLYVLQYQAGPWGVNAPSASEVASLNTHDMPTFAGFWQGLDLGDRLDLGLLDERGLEEETARRAATREALTRTLGIAPPLAEGPPGRRLKAGATPPGGELQGEGTDPAPALGPALRFLASSEAPLVVVNLEDVWLEPAPQNTPGTWRERPNWVRRARLTQEQLEGDAEVTQTLGWVADARANTPGPVT